MTELICIIGIHWKTFGTTSTVGYHWKHTGWCYQQVIFQCQFDGNLHTWNTLEDHWKHTGGTLETHWRPTILSPVAFQCTLGTNFQAYWIDTSFATELTLSLGKGMLPLPWASVHCLVQCTLECHRLTQCTLGYHWATQSIPAGYTGTPLEKLSRNCPTLECHWRNSWLLQPTMDHHWRDYNSPHTPKHI